MSETSVQEMVVTFPGGKRVNAPVEGFEIATDQGVKWGGEASAPEPFTLFLASLATCAGVYVLGFCERRGIPTADLGLVQRWTRDKDGKLLEVTIEIRLPASFPAQYHEAVVRAASQCAVKKAIESPPEFVVRTVVA